METAVHPPDRYGVVAPQVYRSCVFQPVNFTFLAELKLKTIVHLSPEVTLRAVSSFIKDNDIRLFHLGIKFWKPTGWKPMSEDLVKEALELVLDANNHPLLLMCTSGVHQTGTVVGCLRRLQRVYSFTSIIDELRSFAFPAHTRYANETFIEFFDVDLVSLPENLPSWFLTQDDCVDLLKDFSSETSFKSSYTGLAPAYKRYVGSASGPLVEKWLKDVDPSIGEKKKKKDKAAGKTDGSPETSLLNQGTTIECNPITSQTKVVDAIDAKEDEGESLSKEGPSPPPSRVVVFENKAPKNGN